MRILMTLFTISTLLVGAASAGSIHPRPGWAVHDTGKSYEQLISDLKVAIKSEGMFVVTQAGPTGAAAKRGITIPGNRVIGVYNNAFAVRALGYSTAAMVGAPIRFYVTEDEDGTATLSYKKPSHVFAPYSDEGGQGLADLAAELDAIFAAIAAGATAE